MASSSLGLSFKSLCNMFCECRCLRFLSAFSLKILRLSRLTIWRKLLKSKLAFTRDLPSDPFK